MRVCSNCAIYMPPETEHYEIDNEVYCTGCVEEVPYTSYSYYIDGEYVGNSDEDARYVGSLEDEYEEESEEDI